MNQYENHPNMKRIHSELGIAPEDISATHASKYCKMSEDALISLIDATLPSMRYIDYDGSWQRICVWHE